jgi:hypothetical protein
VLGARSRLGDGDQWSSVWRCLEHGGEESWEGINAGDGGGGVAPLYRVETAGGGRRALRGEAAAPAEGGAADLRLEMTEGRGPAGLHLADWATLDRNEVGPAARFG